MFTQMLQPLAQSLIGSPGILLATHILSPTHTHTLNPHVYIYTYVCIIIVHVHTYVVFICTYVYRYIYVCTHMYTYTYVYIDTYTLFLYVHTSQYSGSYFGWPTNPFRVIQTRFLVTWTRFIRRTSQFFFTRHFYLTVFPNIQDQYLHAMESDTMDPRAMEVDVHLPEDETKYTATSQKCPFQWQDTRVWNDIYRHMYIYIHL